MFQLVFYFLDGYVLRLPAQDYPACVGLFDDWRAVKTGAREGLLLQLAGRPHLQVVDAGQAYRAEILPT